MKINIPLSTIHSPSKSKTINQLKTINSLFSLNILKPFLVIFIILSLIALIIPDFPMRKLL